MSQKGISSYLPIIFVVFVIFLIVVGFVILAIFVLGDNNDSGSNTTTTTTNTSTSSGGNDSDPDTDTDTDPDTDTDDDMGDCFGRPVPSEDNPTIGFSVWPYTSAIPSGTECEIPPLDDTSAFIASYKSDGIIRNGAAPLGWVINNNTQDDCSLYGQFYDLVGGYINLKMSSNIPGNTTWGWSDSEDMYGFQPKQSFFVNLNSPSIFNPTDIYLNTDQNGDCVLTPSIESGNFSITIDFDTDTLRPYLTVETCE